MKAQEITSMINLVWNMDASNGPALKYVLGAFLRGINQSDEELTEHDVEKLSKLKNLYNLLIAGRYDLLNKVAWYDMD